MISDNMPYQRSSVVVWKDPEQGLAPLRPPADTTLSEATRRRLHDAVPANTRRAYTRNAAEWDRWCAEAGRTPLPATAETLAEYAAWLADSDLAPSTIAQKIATVRTLHATAGFDHQPDTTLALVILRGHRKARANAGRRAKEAPPILIPALRAMVDTCDPATLTGLRDRCLLVLGIAMMGRRSEIVGLNLDDIRQGHPEGLEVLIRHSKTDQDAQGHTVAIPAGSFAATDPVRVFAAWLDALADRDVTAGPAFRDVSRPGKLATAGRLTPETLNEIVRRAAERAGLPDASRYTAHSLRAGGATIAYAGGAPVSVIAAYGRWSVSSPIVLRYIRAVDQWKDNPMRGVGL